MLYLTIVCTLYFYKILYRQCKFFPGGIQAFQCTNLLYKFDFCTRYTLNFCTAKQEKDLFCYTKCQQYNPDDLAIHVQELIIQRDHENIVQVFPSRN